MSITTLTSPHPRTIELLVSATCFLKYETGTLDYHLMFSPKSFVYTSINHHRNRFSPNFLSQTLMMNILSWNVRGTAGANFRRIFRDLITTHNADIVILTEMRVSGDRVNWIIATLGFERYIKVDAMGFAGGIWVL